jgi:hypothetical protein
MALPMTFNKIALAIAGALLSIPLAVSTEEILHYRTPGGYLGFDLFYDSQDLSNLGLGMLVRVGVNSIVCFGDVWVLRSVLQAASARVSWVRRKSARWCEVGGKFPGTREEKGIA